MTKLNVTLERKEMISFDIEVEDPHDYDKIVEAMGNLAARFGDDSDGDFIYDFAVCDESGKTIVDWEE